MADDTDWSGERGEGKPTLSEVQRRESLLRSQWIRRPPFKPHGVGEHYANGRGFHVSMLQLQTVFRLWNDACFPFEHV
jgi:hypothetical protein